MEKTVKPEIKKNLETYSFKTKHYTFFIIVD
jgi:hypothetical protein